MEGIKLKWFRHDSGAHRDTKIKKLKHKYGITGYGLYWYCLELIAGSVDKNNITFELEDDADLIAIEWGLDRITVNEIMAYMVEIKLFERESSRLTCLKLAKRLDDTNSRNPEIQKLVNSKNALSIKNASENPEGGSEYPEETSDRRDKTRLDKKKETDTSEPQAVTDQRKRKISKTDHEKIIALYHETLPELSKVLIPRWHGSKHAAQLAARWNEGKEFQTLDFWRTFFETVRFNPWWMGVPDKANGQQWANCNLAWLVKRENFDKVITLGVKLEADDVV